MAPAAEHDEGPPGPCPGDPAEAGTPRARGAGDRTGSSFRAAASRARPRRRERRRRRLSRTSTGSTSRRGRGHPPDTNGDVGPTYFSSRPSTPRSGFMRKPLFTFNTFMSQGNFGNLCDTNNFGAIPSCLTHSFEDRRVITDFAFTLDGWNVVNSVQCFAVSRSEPPQSRRVELLLDQHCAAAGRLSEVRHLARTASTCRRTCSPTPPEDRSRARASMPSTSPRCTRGRVQVVTFNAPSGAALAEQRPAPVGHPPPGTPNYFVSAWKWLNALTVYKFHVDWDRVTLSTFTGPDTPLAATSWPNAAVPTRRPRAATRSTSLSAR